MVTGDEMSTQQSRSRVLRAGGTKNQKRAVCQIIILPLLTALGYPLQLQPTYPLRALPLSINNYFTLLVVHRKNPSTRKGELKPSDERQIHSFSRCLNISARCPCVLIHSTNILSTLL